jgi:histidinol-phosphate aminotransferase
MHRRGVLTRDRSKDQGCAGCVRLTVGTRVQMKQAMAAMDEALKEIGWEKA